MEEGTQEAKAGGASWVYFDTYTIVSTSIVLALTTVNALNTGPIK